MAFFEHIYLDNTGIRHVYVDLKNGNGSVGEGKPPSSDVQMETTTETFQSIFAGELSATKAFMPQNLKIKGDMAKAIQLEGLLKKLQKSKL